MGQADQTTPSRHPLAWLGANGVVLVLLLLGLARLDPARNTLAGPPVSVTQVDGGGWESRREIYHGIPARVRFRLPGKDVGAALSLAREVWSEFVRLGTVFNPFDPASEIGVLNAASAGGDLSHALSSDLYDALRLSEELWVASEGRFDPGLWRLKELWQAAVARQQAPSSAELSRAAGPPRWQDVTLQPRGEGGLLELQTGGLQLDLGGLAKGYAVDRVAALVRSSGVRSGLVQLGGEVAAVGRRVDDAPWRIGVQHPLHDGLYGVVTRVGDLRVSTSGNYRQPLVIGGREYYHIFDPTTGHPVPTRILGVTTVDLTGQVPCALLDGAATAITVLGPERGLRLAEALGLDVLILEAGEGGEIVEHCSAGLSSEFERVP